MKKYILITLFIGLLLASGCTAITDSNDSKILLPDTSDVIPTSNNVEITPIVEVIEDGDRHSEFLEAYQFEFYGIPGFVSRLVDQEILQEWLNQFESIDNPYGRRIRNLNFANAVLELNIPKKLIIKESKGLFSEDQIEAVYSGDQKRINEAFVNEYALLSNGYIYTADWLAARSADEYKAEGITEDELYQYIKKINILELQKEYEKIHEQLSLLQKHKSDSVDLVVDENSYSLEWLLTHIVQDYEQEGITSELLEQYIQQLELNKYSPEYEYVTDIMIKLQE